MKAGWDTMSDTDGREKECWESHLLGKGQLLQWWTESHCWYLLWACIRTSPFHSQEWMEERARVPRHSLLDYLRLTDLGEGKLWSAIVHSLTTPLGTINLWWVCAPWRSFLHPPDQHVSRPHATLRISSSLHFSLFSTSGTDMIIWLLYEKSIKLLNIHCVTNLSKCVHVCGVCLYMFFVFVYICVRWTESL